MAYGDPARPDGYIAVNNYTRAREYTPTEIELFIELSKIIHLRSGQLRDQAALRLSEQRYRQTFETNQAVKLIINPVDGQIVEANQAAVAFYGYDPDTLTHMRIMDINIQSEADVRQEMARAEREERLFFNFRHRLASGDIREVEVYSGPVETPQGQRLYSIIHDVTARHQAEAALQASQARLAMTLQGAQLGTWDWNIATGQVIFNERWAEMLGYRLDELEPHVSSWQRLLHPDDEPQVMAAVEAHLVGNSPLYQTEHRLRTKTGGWKWVLDTGKVLERDGQGQAIRMTGIHQDITDRKETERLLQLQHELALTLAATSDITEAFQHVLTTVRHIEGIDGGGGYLVDVETGALELVAHQGLSAEFVAEVTHYSPESPQAELVRTGQPVYSYHKTIAPIQAPDVLRALAVIPIQYNNQSIAALNLASHSQGNLLSGIRAAIEAIASQIGSVIIRIQAEAARRESQQNLQTLFDTLEDFLFILDGQGHIIKTNPVVTKRLGYAPEELLGRHVLDVHPPARRAEAGRIVGEMLAGETDACPVPLQTRDGHLIPVETRVVQGTWDHQPSLFGISRDVTERLAAEVALQESHDELEASLAELQETQEKLIQQERLAAVGQLAAGNAHHFNNILTGILGYAELLQMDPQTPATMRADLAKITTQSRRAAQLVSQLLDFSRKSALQPRLVNLSLFMQEFVTFLDGGRLENIRLDFRMEAGEHQVEADPVRLHEVMTNLVINARDAMPGGGVLSITLDQAQTDGRLECTVCGQIITGEYARLTVRDTGRGIEPEEMPHIFEPFYTTKEVGQGTGLGLAQVYGIVDRHNGHLTVASEVGQGTTITIYLPLVK